MFPFFTFVSVFEKRGKKNLFKKQVFKTSLLWKFAASGLPCVDNSNELLSVFDDQIVHITCTLQLSATFFHTRKHFPDEMVVRWIVSSPVLNASRSSRAALAEWERLWADSDPRERL